MSESKLPIRDESYDVVICVGSFLPKHIPATALPVSTGVRVAIWAAQVFLANFLVTGCYLATRNIYYVQYAWASEGFFPGGGIRGFFLNFSRGDQSGEV